MPSTLSNPYQGAKLDNSPFGQWASEYGPLSSKQQYGVFKNNNYTPAETSRIRELTQIGMQNGWIKPDSGLGGAALDIGKNFVLPVAAGTGIGLGINALAGAGAVGGAAGGAAGSGFTGASLTTPGTIGTAGAVGTGAGIGSGTAAGGGLGTLFGGGGGSWLGGGLSALGTIYAANRAAQSTNRAADMANAAANRAHYTDTSFNNPATGEVSIDPSIRALREASLAQLPGYRNTLNASSQQYTNNLDQTRNQLASNENPFIQARVNPLLAQAAQGRGALTRSMTQRGLGGSSLFANSLGNYDAQTGREIADQRALATNDQLQALTGLDTQRYQAALSGVQALQGLDQQQQSIAAQNLAQELSALGLSQADTAGILQASGLQLQAGQIQNNAYGRAFDTIGRILSPSYSNTLKFA